MADITDEEDGFGDFESAYDKPSKDKQLPGITESSSKTPTVSSKIQSGGITISQTGSSNDSIVAEHEKENTKTINIVQSASVRVSRETFVALDESLEENDDDLKSESSGDQSAESNVSSPDSQIGVSTNEGILESEITRTPRDITSSEEEVDEITQKNNSNYDDSNVSTSKNKSSSSCDRDSDTEQPRSSDVVQQKEENHLAFQPTPRTEDDNDDDDDDDKTVDDPILEHNLDNFGSLADPSKRLLLKERLRELELNLRSRDNKEWDQLTRIARLIKEHAKSVISTSNQVTEFLSAQNRIEDLIKFEISKIGSHEMGTMSASALQTWKAVSYAYSVTESDKQKQVEMEKLVKRSTEHLSEICEVVNHVVHKAVGFRSEVNSSWKNYEKEIKNDISTLSNGGNLKRDPFLVHRIYEDKIRKMEEFGFAHSIESLSCDLTMSDEQRLRTTQSLLLDYFSREQRALKSKIDLVNEAFTQISSVDPKHNTANFLLGVDKLKCEYNLISRKDIIICAKLPTEIVKSGNLLLHDPNMKAGKLRPVYSVVTISGFMHLFQSEFTSNPFSSFRLSSISEVSMSGSDVFQFYVQHSWFGKPTLYTMKAENGTETNSWVSLLMISSSQEKQQQNL